MSRPRAEAAEEMSQLMETMSDKLKTQARISELEAQCDRLRAELDKALWCDGVEAEFVRAQAFEEAAKVARTCISGLGAEAAIRALASKQPVASEQHHQENQHQEAANTGRVPAIASVLSPRPDGQGTDNQEDEDDGKNGHGGHSKHAGRETP